MPETNHIHVDEPFPAFFSRWLISHERYLHDLLLAIGNSENEQRCRELIDQATTHYNLYFQAKKRAIHENVFLVLAPTWLTSLEKAHLWLGGYRPGLAFSLAVNNVLDMTEDQSRRIIGFMREVKEEENQAMLEFERAHERMVSSTMEGMARELRNGLAESNILSAIERLTVSMKSLVEYADYLRRKAAGVIVEILKPAQAVRFLASMAQMQLNLRRWGMQAAQRPQAAI